MDGQVAEGHRAKRPAQFRANGGYTNSSWHQRTVVDDCIVVDGRLAVPGQLRPAVLKRIHRGHPGQEAMLDVSRYLWWPHMHKDIMNMAEECRTCTRYGKNAKYIIPNNALAAVSRTSIRLGGTARGY